MALATYHETLRPWIMADESTVTLSTTNKALVPSARYSELNSQFFDVPGKKIWLHASGKITTAATPGNLTLALLWGTNADANGTSLVASAAQTLVANQTTIPWNLDIYIQCRSTGTAGSLFVQGYAMFGTSVIAVGTFLMPASAPAAVGSLDLTGASVPSLQALRSGSTAETMTVQDFAITPMN